MTFADFCSDFSGEALMSCDMGVFSSFVTGTLESSFPKSERKKEKRNQLAAHRLSTQRSLNSY